MCCSGQLGLVGVWLVSGRTSEEVREVQWKISKWKWLLTGEDGHIFTRFFGAFGQSSSSLLQMANGIKLGKDTNACGITRNNSFKLLIG